VFGRRVPEEPGPGRRRLDVRWPLTVAGLLVSVREARRAAALEADVAELRQSRRRLVEAAETERKELERSLHEGAQQRLVAVRLRLGQLRGSLGTRSNASRELERIEQDLDAAFHDLRELAQALYPSNLSSLGLAPAIAAAARQSPSPVDVDVDVAPDDLPAGAEAVLYRVCVEVLATGVARSIVVARDGELVRFELAGDALPADAVLQALRDEVAALDGTLVAQGTTLSGAFRPQASGRMPR
jgi:signal transduction histidine kinase